jgi:hypothetical protein
MMGKMVAGVVEVDVNGIPEKLPSIFYRRHHLLKFVPESFEEGKERKFSPERLIDTVAKELDRIALEVDRIVFERELRERPVIPSKDFDVNKRIIAILRGRSYGAFAHGRIEISGAGSGKPF